ncbi:MAG: winged helix-turn-helix domain-containing protein [Alphaproteobacteria bacterium]|nr:winged helix-turn-helix domain-containing protein [Alphaproteobacteria bacterium]
MANNPSIALATDCAAIRESLTRWCAVLDIRVEPKADIWIIDGHHAPKELPKAGQLLVLGPVPKDIKATAIIPTPVTLAALTNALHRNLVAPFALREGWSFDANQRTLSHGTTPPISLTEKEAALLQQLLQHAPSEVSRDSLLKSVWAYEKDVDTHTLETHVYRLRQKAGSSILDIVTTEQGYKVAL